MVFLPSECETPVPHPAHVYYVGLDLGQAAEFTALAIVRRDNPYLRGASGKPPQSLECIGLKRYDLGTTYPAIVADLAATLAEPTFNQPRFHYLTTLLIDETGVGRPILEMFRQAGLKPKAVTLTSGFQVVRPDPHDLHIPKRDLVSAVQAGLQTERLKIASRLPYADTLVRELLAFRVKINLNAGDSFEAWREGEHDDLVFALALAVWGAETVRARWAEAY